MFGQLGRIGQKTGVWPFFIDALCGHVIDCFTPAIVWVGAKGGLRFRMRMISAISNTLG